LESVTEEIDKATPEEKRTVEKQDKKEQKEVNDLQERIGNLLPIQKVTVWKEKFLSEG